MSLAVADGKPVGGDTRERDMSRRQGCKKRDKQDVQMVLSGNRETNERVWVMVEEVVSSEEGKGKKNRRESRLKTGQVGQARFGGRPSLARRLSLLR